MKDTESHSNKDLREELEARGYILYNEIYDYVDSCLFDDISSVFESLSCEKKQELRDLVINFK